MMILKNKYVWSVVAFVLLVAVIFLALPKPLDMDLGKVGNGAPSVVFIYDPNLAISGQQAEQMVLARDGSGEQGNFLIARAGSPTSQAFRERYQAGTAELLFFDGNGQLIRRSMALLNADELIQALAPR